MLATRPNHEIKYGEPPRPQDEVALSEDANSPAGYVESDPHSLPRTAMINGQATGGRWVR
jgi:hypothetical protein